MDTAIALAPPCEGPPCEGWIPSVDIKIDPKQMTFTVPSSLLPLTRQTLFMRYMSELGGFDSQPGYSATWVDETKENTPLALPKIESLDKVPDIPHELFRTKITIYKNSHQLVKITIHMTTGCVLIQGKKCSDWRQKEFYALVKCVETLYQLHMSGKHRIPDEMLTVPIIVPSPTRTRTSPRLGLSDPKVSALVVSTPPSPKRPALPPPPPSNTDTEMSTAHDVESQSNHGLTLQPTSATLTNLPPHNPEEDKAERLRKPSDESSSTPQLPPTTGALLPSSTIASVQTEETVSPSLSPSLLAAPGVNVDTQTPPPEYYSKAEIHALFDDIRIQTKNELKVIFDQKIDDLTCTIEILQKDNDIHKKEKRDLRSQINDLKSQLKKKNYEISPSSTSTNQLKSSTVEVEPTDHPSSTIPPANYDKPIKSASISPPSKPSSPALPPPCQAPRPASAQTKINCGKVTSPGEYQAERRVKLDTTCVLIEDSPAHPPPRKAPHLHRPRPQSMVEE